LLIAWFGPRGLGSLLLILVPVFAGVPGTEPLFVICCLVVLLSVALHGGSLMFLARKACPAVPMPVNLNAARPSAAKDGDSQSPAAGNTGDRVTWEDFRRLQLSGAPVLVLDARSDASFSASAYQAQGALRVPPDQAARRVKELNIPRETWIAVFCA
jgi:hypothetical protein